MKPSEILRKAAQLVERGDKKYGCHAIGAVMGLGYMGFIRYDEIPPEVARYFALVGPNDKKGAWWLDYGPRIIGLCLAAAIAESEGN